MSHEVGAMLDMPSYNNLYIYIYECMEIKYRLNCIDELHNLMGASLATHRIRSWNQLPIKPLHTTINAGFICHLHKTVSSRASEETENRIFNDL